MNKIFALILTILMLISVMPVITMAVTPNYLTFTAQEADSSITFGYVTGTNVKYSTKTSTGSWSSWADCPSGTKATLTNIGDQVRYKALDIKTSESQHFTMTGKIEASGDVTSLTNETGGNATLNNKCYYGMFFHCQELTKAPSLPSTTLAEDCYTSMFAECKSLLKAPDLPATILAKSCYSEMFNGCASLTDAPTLSATTLTDNCYNSMFNNCKSLKEAPVLPAKQLAESCYDSMFAYCESLEEAPELPATTLEFMCYYSMFSGCAALKKAPVLPATILDIGCYVSMFAYCESLEEAPDLPAKILTNNCYQNMFSNCGSLTDIPALPATELAEYCCYEMFSGCISLEEAPALPATTLANECYENMFKGCTALEEAPELPATTLEYMCYYGMFTDCKSLEKAPALPAVKLAEGCYYYMFKDCISLKNIPNLPATVLYSDSYKQMFKGCESLNISTSSGSNTYKWAMANLATESDLYNANENMFADCPSCASLEVEDTDYYCEPGVTYYSKYPVVYSALADSDTEHGEVSVSNTQPLSTDSITITATGDSGYKVKVIEVVDLASETNVLASYTSSTATYSKFNDNCKSVKIKATFEEGVEENNPGGNNNQESGSVSAAALVVAPLTKEIPVINIGESKPEIKVIVPDNTYVTENNSFASIAPIIIEQNRTFLGIRDMAYALGIAPEAVKWDESTKTASITKSGATIYVTQGSKDIKITYGGYIYTKTNDVSAINKYDRIYLPFRVIFELFGYEVNWDNDTRVITCK